MQIHETVKFLTQITQNRIFIHVNVQQDTQNSWDTD